nr:MAG TPA: hypothetical protein [Caudoviricetes sp.]
MTNFTAKFIVKIAINIWQYQKKDVFLQRKNIINSNKITTQVK